MRNRLSAPAESRSIPAFALYGEPNSVPDTEFVHIELIETRSSLHDWHIGTHQHMGLFQVLCLFKGRVRAIVDDVVWDVEAPAAITVQPGAVHSFDFSQHTHGYVLTIEQSLLFTTPQRHCSGYEVFLREPRLFDMSRQRDISTRLEALLTLIQAEFTQSLPEHAAMVEWLVRSVLLLLKRVLAHDDTASRSGRSELELFTRFRALVEAHYREQLNFTFDGLQGARSSLQRIDEFLLKLQEVAGAGAHSRPTALVSEFEAALDDDLNISAALGALFEFVRDANKRAIAPEEAAGILSAWRRFDEVLGFGFPVRSDVPADVQGLVEQRQAARKAKDFKRSDEIRDQLAKQGWIIEDTPKGPRAKRVGSESLR